MIFDDVILYHFAELLVLFCGLFDFVVSLFLVFLSRLDGGGVELVGEKLCGRCGYAGLFLRIYGSIGHQAGK